jgi:hypothetical protein
VAPIDASAAREFLEATVTAVSVLGGAMAYWSGYSASRAVAEGQAADLLSQRINEGLAEGFAIGWPMSIAALIIEAWAG